VPLLIAMPGQWHEQTRVRKVASLIDVAPTILDLMDLSVPADYQGSSLLEGRERAALFYTDYSLSLVGLRDGNWKFIHELGSGQSKLFDLGSDPAERHNLALHHPARVGVWRRHLARWAAAQKAAMLNRQALPVQLSSSSSTIQ
jgi:arylsulfatase A-like enzyme